MEKSFHHTLMKAYFSFHRTVMEQAKNAGLTSGQPKILEFLSESDGVEQKVIAAHCEIETATAGSILTRMESAGLIERRRQDGNPPFYLRLPYHKRTQSCPKKYSRFLRKPKNAHSTEYQPKR